MSRTIIAPAVTAEPKQLANDLAAVKGAVASRSAISLLTGVRVFTAGDVAYLETTDMEVAVRRQVAALVTGELDIIVPHADLAKAVKLFAKRERVELARVDDDRLAVTDGTRTVNLRALDSEHWPTFPADAAADETSLLRAGDARLFGAVIERAGRFASTDQTRPILTGLAFNYAEPEPRVWATDSYRLADLALPAIATRPIPENHRDGTVNVPARGLLMAAKTMRKCDGEVTVSTKLHHAIVRYAGEVWAMRIIDGQYPDFRQLIPVTHEVNVKVPVAQLVGACDVAVAFARRNAPMRLHVNGSVKLTGTTPDVADFAELLPGAIVTDGNGRDHARTIITSEGIQPATLPGDHDDDELVIGLNPEFVRDIAAAHVADTAELRLITPLRPVLFVDGGDLYLQMPIRLNI